jgi:thioredoxin-dependent peroxiredoxin
MAPKHPLIGQPAPVVSLPNADGTTYEIKAGTEGKPMAVFFYPAAGTFDCPRLNATRIAGCADMVLVQGTYGCTREVCAFRDALTGTSFPGG